MTTVGGLPAHILLVNASSELVRIHTALGDTMLPWAIALTVVALAVLAREVLAAPARRQSPTVVVGG